MPTPETLDHGVMLLALGLLVGVARTLGEVARRLHQPAILGEILAGVLLGPTVFGALLPGWHGYLFPQQGPQAAVFNGVGLLAVVLFLLVAGMEVDLSVVWKQGRAALQVGIWGTLIPFVMGLVGALLLPSTLGHQADADPWIFALFVATAFAISALPVIAKTLKDLDLYRTDLGMIVVSAAIFNDVIGWTVFALILGMISTNDARLSVPMILGLTLLFTVVVLSVGRSLIHRLLPVLKAHTHHPGGVLGFAITLALFGAAAAEWIGIHAIFGAFLVGVALGDSPHLEERTRMLIDDFTSFIFAPLFFASIGLHVDFVHYFDPLLVIVVLVFASVAKLVGATWGARWGGLSKRDSLAVGWAMNARGAMEIILGSLALEAGIIRPPLFVALVIMAIVTSALSGPLIRRTLRRRQAARLLGYLSPKLFVRNLQAAGRLEAIRELAALVAREHGLDAADIERQAWAREQLAATGIGHGVAIPHARLDHLSTPLIVIGLSDAGIAFDAPDGRPAHAVFLVLTGEADPGTQLELAADIARTFRAPQVLNRVLRAASFTELLAALRSAADR